ncbi:MAG: ABC transporter permease [Armatimonadota bacterium]|nr:ABC transporter permease [Armatimonadota bacterium]MDR7421505.1 ABC transporter permease [Armatimonadota bacterium]MDR7455637.1 ABC transporter permease [Armatimonadota bacterium]MDR7458068.1 ABC transporter permease [Armatimonadota bacterium]MDR7497039.1 ABC transporter permease [Armatimonadota bacterium]
MIGYLVQRLAHLVWVLLAVSILVFLLVHLSGDPVRLLTPLDARPEDIERVRRLYGLDQPLPVQYWRFLKDAARGELGESFRFSRPALELVLDRLPNTALLALTTIALTVGVGIPVGLWVGSRAGSLVDWAVSLATFVCISLPSFWLGVLLILLFADRLRWLPASGFESPLYLVLPSLTLAVYTTGLITRLVRADVLEVLRQDFIRTARAKGLGERVVRSRHALRNALISTVTVLGLQLGNLLGGSVVVEAVFAWPGVGWLMLQGIQTRDLPVVRAVVLIVGTLFVLINLAVDLLYLYLDPRIRYDHGR